MMTTNDLEAFFTNGWNRHDVDLLMTFMSDDCVFESTAGPDAWGTRHAGRERVRQAFARVFEMFPDARFGEARHLVAGNRGVSESRFTGTTPRARRSRSTAATSSRSRATGSRSRARTSRRGPREARAGQERGRARAAVRISSSDGNFPTPAKPSAHSMLAQRTMPSRSIRNWPLSWGHCRSMSVWSVWFSV